MPSINNIPCKKETTSKFDARIILRVSICLEIQPLVVKFTFSYFAEFQQLIKKLDVFRKQKITIFEQDAKLCEEASIKLEKI
jgi:hypothetical protein